jgi:transcription initiation factor TFIIIB Brf1 subunit/transcription initiation factor TFIIB
MGMISCPYCTMEISLSAVEAEDGYCPECGAVITSSSIMTDKDDDFDDLDGEDDSEPVDSVDDIDIEDIEDVDFDEDIEEE